MEESTTLEGKKSILMKSAKQVKKIISEKMTSRKDGISVVLEECDDMDRIEIKYPKVKDNYISLNPITEILRKNNFFVAQVIDFYYDTKRVVLLIREHKKNE